MNYTFWRGLKYAFQDFWRNIWLSLVTITVLVLALTSVNVLISLRVLSAKVIDSVQDKVDVSVYFRAETEAAQIDNFRQRLSNMPEVRESVFVSKEEALAEFQANHAADPKIIEALAELNDNPLVDSIVIKAKSIEDYQKILAFLKLEDNAGLIKEQNYTDHEKIIERVRSISDKVEKVSLTLTAVFTFIAILIVFNAVKVMIYTHREEIAVMKLVGAGNWFIRLPFVLESVLFALLAVGIAVGLLYVVFSAVGPQLAAFLETYDFNLVAYYNENFLKIFGAELAVAVGLNVLSCGLALRRYLR